MAIVLTPGQEELRYKLKKWYMAGNTRSKPWFSYSGAAGTGKTTIIKVLVEDLGLKPFEYTCAAYTGKAALQLLRNELPGQTIHSLIYNVWTEPTKVKDEFGNSKMVFKLKTSLRESLDPRLKLIFIDEATMVNDMMRDELLSFKIPIVFIGDMNQLPPVFGISSVMLNPDHVLTQIMRQREGDPIVQLSQMVLNDIPLRYGVYGKSRILDRIDVDYNLINDYDQILCVKNQTRADINDHIRYQVFHRASREPVIGDKIVCRQNNREIQYHGIFLTNGLIGFIRNLDRSKVHKGYYIIDFQPDFLETCFENVKLDRKYILLDWADQKNFGMCKNEKFEYGYVITVHISQGSQFSRVLFLDERAFDFDTQKKLRYTAITRAVDSVDIVIDNSYYNRFTHQSGWFDQLKSGY